MPLLIFLALVILIGFIWYAKKETLSKKAKRGLLLLIVLLMGSAWWYEYSAYQKSEHNRLMLSAFKQGKTLQCGDVEVSYREFVFVSGTLSFIPNDQNQRNKGVVIDMARCKIEQH